MDEIVIDQNRPLIFSSDIPDELKEELITMKQSGKYEVKANNDRISVKLISQEKDMSFGLPETKPLEKELLKDSTVKLTDTINASAKHIHDQNQLAEEIVDNTPKGKEISLKDIKKIYGPNWRKSLACSPIDPPKRDKKKAKAARKARKANRKRK